VPSGRARRLLGGLGVGYLHTVATVVVGLWLTPYLLGQLGSHDYGLWLLGTQLVFYLGLMDLGVVALVPRDVAAATGGPAEERLADLQRLIGQTARLVLWQLPFVALVAAIVLWLLPQEWEPLRGPLQFVVVTFVATFPCRILVAVLQGLQDLAFVGAAQLVSWGAGALATVVAVVAGLDLYALAVGWATTQVTLAGMSWVRLEHRYPHLLPRRLPALAVDVVTGRVGRGAWISLEQLAQVLLSGTDLVLIGKLLGPQAVVVYACTGRLMGLLANQSQMLIQLSLPALSELRTAAPRTRLFEVSRGMMQLMFLSGGAIVAGVLIVNETFVDWWVGGGQFGGTGLTALLLAGMLLRKIRVTAGYALYCFGNERRLAVTSIAEGLVAVAVMVTLLPIWGLHGAALGPIVGVCLVGLPGHFVALAREEGVSLSKSLAPLLPWTIRLVVLLSMTVAVASLGLAGDVMHVAMVVPVVCLSYVYLMGPVLYGAPLGPMLADRLASWMSAMPGVGRRIGRPTSA